MHQEPGVIMHIVKACVVLHDLLWQRSGRDQFQTENMGLDLDNVFAGEPSAILLHTSLKYVHCIYFCVNAFVDVFC